MRRRTLLSCALAAIAVGAIGCSGPEAPDAAVCRDVIHRLCHAPRCPSVDDVLAPGDDCEGTLLERSGCSDDAFVFTTPDRQRFLECRGTLVHSGTDPEAAPACTDVDAMLNECGEVASLLKGAK